MLQSDTNLSTSFKVRCTQISSASHHNGALSVLPNLQIILLNTVVVTRSNAGTALNLGL
jgi:hypothetical protein